MSEVRIIGTIGSRGLKSTDKPLAPKSAFESQIGGNHYKEMAIQPLEYIVKNNLNFVEGNVIKYVTRYKVKGGLEDLRKAKHYLDLLIELEEQKNKDGT